MNTKRDIENQIQFAEEKGIEKGIEKRTIAIAREMKIDGVVIDLIMKYTGLTKEQIEAL